MFFRFNDGFQPEFMPNHKLEATIAKELPHFLAWLLKWEIPSYVKSKEPRYGISSFHDAELGERASIMASSAHRLTEALDILRKHFTKCGDIKQRPKEIQVSATEMLAHLNEIPGLRSIVKILFGEHAWSGASNCDSTRLQTSLIERHEAGLPLYLESS